VIVVLAAVVLALAAGLALGLVLARRSSQDEHVLMQPQTPAFGAIVAPGQPSGSVIATGAAAPVARGPGVAPIAPGALPPLSTSDPAATAASIADTIADSMMAGMSTTVPGAPVVGPMPPGAVPESVAPMVASLTASTSELAPVLARLRELGADGVIDPTERAGLEAKAAAALPGSTIEELTVDSNGYRLRVRHAGADIVASGTWQGGAMGQSIAVSQTVTHAFDATSGGQADLSAIADPQLRSMVEGMLRSLDPK
jgi:hypothetical protein